MPGEKQPTAAGVVRKATELDAPQIAQLYAMLVSDSAVRVLPQRLAEIASDPNTAVFIFEDGEAVLGTVLVSLCADVTFGRRPFAVVENIVVDQAARGLRIGERLLQAVEAFCTAADCSKIMLLSGTSRERAHTFFERCGYSGSTKRGFVKYRTAFGARD
jgi:N-acetylglutamate synthase-like GNAT family acetyltransferase